MALLAREAQEAVTQILVSLEHTCELRRDCRDILMVYAAGRHALVLCIDEDRHTRRLERFSNAIGNLSRHGFLRLQAFAENLDHTSDLRDANDLMGRHISDMSFAKDRYHVVLTMAFNVDVS